MLSDLLIIIGPLLISNILHMGVVRADLFRSLKIAIHERAFGQNKTWRGVIVVTTANTLCLPAWLRSFTWEYAALGASLGFAYVLFELPNSYQKRRRGIRAGASDVGVTQKLVDKMDSALGVSLVYSLWFGKSFAFFAFLFLTSIAVHITFSYLLIRLRLKESF